MTEDLIEIKETSDLTIEQVLPLYAANGWSSAKKPNELFNALLNSHTLVTAWDKDRLIGLASAISDGYLVVFYPHLIVLPEFHKRGIGRRLVSALCKKYDGFHQQILVADSGSVEFYAKCGFELAGSTQAMWIYQGEDHD